ncbi:MAG: hypothetical protein NT150_01150 [Bacteroidetes bacterium]|nr:hypothetical protein [Bacteroidota bacterium]
MLVKENIQEKPKNKSYFKLQSVVFTICFFAFLNFNLVAQDTLPKQKMNPYQFKNSISLSAFILLGSVQINYERLVGDRHGLLAEGYYAFSGSSEGTPTIGLSYRYHFKKSLNGAFANAFYRWGDVHYKAVFEENGVEKSFQMRTTTNLVGLGLGYRKQWSNGLAAVLRGGYGYQIGAEYDWLPSQPLSLSNKATAEALQGLDIEISVGYSF